MSTPPVGLDLSTYTPLDSGQPAEGALKLRQSLSYGVQQDPDQYAKLLKQQQVTGMAPEVAAPLAGETQQAIDVESLNPEQMAVSHPRTAAWAAHPDNAAVAGADELHRMTRIEQHAAVMRAIEPSFTDRLGDAAQAAFSFLGGQGQLKQQLFDFPLSRLAIGAVRGTIDTAGNLGSFIGIHGDNGGPNLFQRVAQRFSPESFGEKPTGLDALAENVGPMIPALVASGGTSLIARTLGLSDKAAKVLAGLSVGGMFTVDQGGRTYTAMRAQGASDYEARLAANRVAAINAPANALFGATEAVPFLRDNPLATSLGLGGATGVSGQLAQNVVTGQPLTKGLPTAAIQGAAVQGGMHLGFGFLDSMGETVNEVEQSKLRTRSPERFQEALEAQYAGDASVRIPAQDFISYFEGKKLDPAAVASEVGVANLEEAAAAGSDLEIPKANFFGRLDPEHQRGLLPDIVDPSTELTARQTEAGRQELEEALSSGKLQQLVEDFQQADAETQATPEWKKVQTELKQRYVDAGETETAADNYATLQANAIANLAKNAGLKPDELLALHNPQIVAAEAAPGDVLYQTRGGEGEPGDEGDRHLVHNRWGDVGTEFTSTMPGEQLKPGDIVRENTENRALKVLSLEGKTATAGAQWYKFRVVDANVARQAGETVIPNVKKAPAPLEDEDEVEGAEPESGFAQRRKERNLEAAKAQGDLLKAAKEPLEGAAAEPAAGEGASRGWFRILGPGRYEIGKTKIGDFSTFIHEPAHAYLEFFRELTQRDEASPQLKDDFKKIAEWLGTTPEEAQKNGFTREQHEQWARANEQYVREGNAPSAGLRRVFHHFSVWLSTIYRRASALGVELSGDIRGVMDRLYAGEDAVNRAEQETARQPLFTSPEEAGFTEEEYRNYAEAKGIEVDKAREQVRAELEAAAERERSQEFREERSNVRDAVTQQVDARPEYTAIRSLRRGALDDGTPLALNREALVDQFGEERVKALNALHRGLYRNEGGTDAETAAELFGFRSGEEMMRALENAPRRSQAIEAATREYLVNKYGDVRYDGTLNDRARFAIENDERAKNIYREMKTLKTRLAAVEKKAADAKAAMRAIALEPLEHYQEAARQMIDQKAIADLQPNRYLDASRRYSREAFDALRKGNARAAADAKNKELLNHFLFREASAARDWADKFQKYVARVQSVGIQQRLGLADQNAKQAGSVGDYRDQFNWLLNRFHLFAGRADRPERTLREWADEMQAQGKDTVIAPGLLDDSRFADYRSVPLAELRDLHDALVNVRHLAQQEFKMFVQGKQVKFAEAKQAMIAAARENLNFRPEKVFEENQSITEKLMRPLQYIDARLMRMERLIEWLDGGKSGPWHDNLWNLAADAQGDEYKLQEDVTRVVTDALADMPAEMRRRLWTEKVTVEGVPEPISRRRLLSIAFNMGNEGNLDRLQKTFDTFGWDRDAIKKIGGMLTREEWTFVQKAWDSLKPLGERADELQRRLTGLPLSKVKVTPFRVKLLEGGEELELAGGYFPIVMDPRFSQRAIEQDAKESAQNAMQSGYVRATTSKGYTKERTGFGGPLLLDYERAMTSHVAKVAKDLSHREFMLASQRFLLDTEVRATLRQTLGQQYQEQFMPWLRTIINDNNGSVQERTDTFKDLLQAARSNIVAASLGFNASTSLLQISHAPRMMLYAKPASLAQAFGEFLARPVQMTREIHELSPNEMRFRGDNLDRDIRAALQKPEYNGGYTRKVAVAARFALEMMDHLLSHTLWKAAFNDALAKYGDADPEAQAKAVHEADSAVRLGLGTNAPKDLPAIMRSSEVNKLLTTLYGFHSGVYNQLRDIGHQFGRDRSIGKLTYAGILTVLVPSVLGNMLTGRGPKDDENAGWWAAKQALLFSADTVPMLRALASAMEAAEHGRVSDVQFSPIEGALTKAGKALVEAFQDKPDKDWPAIGLDAAEAAGELAGIPGAHQVVKTLRYVKRASEGKVQNPNPWNAVVGGGR